VLSKKHAPRQTAQKQTPCFKQFARLGSTQQPQRLSETNNECSILNSFQKYRIWASTCEAARLYSLLKKETKAIPDGFVSEHDFSRADTGTKIISGL